MRDNFDIEKTIQLVEDVDKNIDIIQNNIIWFKNNYMNVAIGLFVLLVVAVVIGNFITRK